MMPAIFKYALAPHALTRAFTHVQTQVKSTVVDHTVFQHLPSDLWGLRNEIFTSVVRVRINIGSLISRVDKREGEYRTLHIPTLTVTGKVT